MKVEGRSVKIGRPFFISQQSTDNGQQTLVMRSLSLSKCRTYPLVGCLRQAQAPYDQSLKHFIETSQHLNLVTRCLRVLVTLFWAFATRRAFRYIFFRFISPRSQIPVPKSHFPFPNPIFRYAPKGCRCNP